MRFSTPFFTAVSAFLAASVQANPVASPEANITARTTYFSGDATFYYPDGNVGACGAPMQNSDFVVALSSAHYDGGAHCWQHLNVNYNGNNIDVTIGDLCPGCATDQIDLSSGAFSALAPLDVGVIPVVWNFE
ncbi:Riboflavin-aldehyde forming enzyme [Mycena sanguinolenta]|uniref:Riboflavin-aldehyde forming enzyme n=1 Tax=Mycena sanguinolenta TaxID=230812 RepID=A0A8H6YIG8_9AGAR|nr:Riboflavin-aldehyde forming enzyme [Mycena sanguinolenta]